VKRHHKKPELIGPWRNIHTAIWLIGLAYIALYGRWWPGILILIGISLILEAILMQYKPEAFEQPERPPFAPAPAAPPSYSTPAPTPAAPVREHRLELLPLACPHCGAPVRHNDIKWTGPQSAECTYCGSNLPMKSG